MIYGKRLNLYENQLNCWRGKSKSSLVLVSILRRLNNCYPELVIASGHVKSIKRFDGLLLLCRILRLFKPRFLALLSPAKEAYQDRHEIRRKVSWPGHNLRVSIKEMAPLRYLMIADALNAFYRTSISLRMQFLDPMDLSPFVNELVPVLLFFLWKIVHGIWFTMWSTEEPPFDEPIYVKRYFRRTAY